MAQDVRVLRTRHLRPCPVTGPSQRIQGAGRQAFELGQCTYSLNSTGMSLSAGPSLAISQTHHPITMSPRHLDQSVSCQQRDRAVDRLPTDIEGSRQLLARRERISGSEPANFDQTSNELGQAFPLGAVDQDQA
jgi:hypothetical protein